MRPTTVPPLACARRALGRHSKQAASAAQSGWLSAFALVFGFACTDQSCRRTFTCVTEDVPLLAAGGAGGAPQGASGNGAASETGPGLAPPAPTTVGNLPCIPETTRSCVEDGLFGSCAEGTEQCSPDGVWSACSIQPLGSDSCVPGNDDNCNGAVNEGCACIENSQRFCSGVDPALVGSCALGSATCQADGSFSACDVSPAIDSCAIAGDDSDCNGTPNSGCPCSADTTEPCGPLDLGGRCSPGVSTCVAGQWSTCEGAVYPSARDCTSPDDNDCDGVADNTLDTTCQCPVSSVQPCEPEPSSGGCRVGTQTCELAPSSAASLWGVCQFENAPDDTPCGGGTCQDGACVCAAGTTACSDGCADLLNDPANCGECGNACQDTFCTDGACRVLTVRINEIFPGGAFDWVELFNGGDSAADISGWRIVDGDGVNMEFPPNTVIEGGSYLVADIGDVLGPGQDAVQLFSADGVVDPGIGWGGDIESQIWSRCPNGTGSLGLRDSALATRGATNNCL